MLGAHSALAGPEIPHDALAWWRFDPTGFTAARSGTPGREVFLAGLRSVVSSGILGDGLGAYVAQGLLAMTDIGAVPHTVCVTELDATRRLEGTGVDVHDLKIVIQLDSPNNHEQYLRTLRALLVDAQEAGNPDDDVSDSRQRIIDLPGRIRGVAFRRDDWKPWQEVSWCSTDDAFLVGIGENALRDWLTPDDAHEDDTPAWLAHRALLDTDEPRGDTFAEAYLDIDGVRAAAPTIVAFGRSPRMLDALEVRTARTVMLHARSMPPPDDHTPRMIAVDLTADERVGDMTRDSITSRHWLPDKVRVPAPPGSYAIAFRADWDRVLDRALAVYEATVRDNDLPAFRRKRESWERANADAIASLPELLGNWFVLSDFPTPVLPVPGLCTLYCAANEGASPARLTALVHDLTDEFADDIARPNDSTWALKLDRRGVLKMPVWGVCTRPGDPPVFIGAWGFPAIDANRQWLAEP